MEDSGFSDLRFRVSGFDVNLRHPQTASPQVELCLENGLTFMCSRFQRGLGQGFG